MMIHSHHHYMQIITLDEWEFIMIASAIIILCPHVYESLVLVKFVHPTYNSWVQYKSSFRPY